MKPTILILALQAVFLTWTPSTTPNATTTLLRDGVALASGLNAASYVDTAVKPGSTYVYTAVAVLGEATSAPSNGFTATIPVTKPALTPSVITFTSSSIVANFTRITAVARGASSTKLLPTGTLTWTIDGVQFFTTALSRSGVAIESFWTPMVNNLPITITYSGDANFAPSSTTIGP